VFDPSVEQIIGSCSLIIVGTACRIVYGHFTNKWKLDQMDKATKLYLAIERERRKLSARQLDRPRPPPSP
jgi:hypothetical protein